jgi:hypothetical protein
MYSRVHIQAFPHPANPTLAVSMEGKQDMMKLTFFCTSRDEEIVDLVIV